MYKGNGTKMMVYNMKRCPKIKDEKKEQRERKLMKYDTRRKNSRYLIILFWLGR